MPTDLPTESGSLRLSARPRRLRQQRWLIVASVPVVLLLAFAGGYLISTSSSQPLPKVPFQTPVEATASWFRALNACNVPLINAHFSPSKRGSWTCIDPFTHVHCVSGSQTPTKATVNCTFDPQNDPRVGNTGDTFWSIYLELSDSGRWLVTDWGQP